MKPKPSQQMKPKPSASSSSVQEIKAAIAQLENDMAASAAACKKHKDFLADRAKRLGVKLAAKKKALKNYLRKHDARYAALDKERRAILTVLALLKQARAHYKAGKNVKISSDAQMKGALADLAAVGSDDVARVLSGAVADLEAQRAEYDQVEALLRALLKKINAEIAQVAKKPQEKLLADQIKKLQAQLKEVRDQQKQSDAHCRNVAAEQRQMLRMLKALLNSALGNCKGVAAETAASLKQCEKQLGQKEAKIRSLQKQLQQAKASSGSGASNAKQAQQIASLTKQLTAAKARTAAVTASKNSKIAALKAEIKALSGKHGAAAKAITQKNKTIRKQAEEIASLKRRLHALSGTHTSASASVGRLSRQLKAARAATAKCSAAKSRCNESLVKSDARVKAAQRHSSTLDGQLVALNNKFEQFKLTAAAKLKQCKDDHRRAQQCISQRNTIDTLKAKLATTQQRLIVQTSALKQCRSNDKSTEGSLKRCQAHLRSSDGQLKVSRAEARQLQQRLKGALAAAKCTADKRRVSQLQGKVAQLSKDAADLSACHHGKQALVAENAKLESQRDSAREALSKQQQISRKMTADVSRLTVRLGQANSATSKCHTNARIAAAKAAKRLSKSQASSRAALAIEKNRVKQLLQQVSQLKQTAQCKTSKATAARLERQVSNLESRVAQLTQQAKCTVLKGRVNGLEKAAAADRRRIDVLSKAAQCKADKAATRAARQASSACQSSLSSTSKRLANAQSQNDQLNNKIGRLTARIKAMEKDIKTHQKAAACTPEKAALASSKKQLAKEQTANRQLRLELARTGVSLETARQDLVRSRGALHAAKKQSAMLEHQLEIADKEEKATEARNTQLSKRVVALQGARAQLESALAKLRRDVQSSTQEVAQLESQLKTAGSNRAAVEKALAAARAKLQRALDESTSTSKQLATVEKDLKSSTAERDTLAAQLASARAHAITLSNSLARAHSAESQLTASVKALRVELTTASSALKNALAGKANAQTLVQSLLTQRAQLRAQVAELGDAAKCTALKAALKHEARHVDDLKSKLGSARRSIASCNLRHDGNAKKVSALVDQLEVVVRKAKATRDSYQSVTRSLQSQLHNANGRLVSMSRRCKIAAANVQVTDVEVTDPTVDQADAAAVDFPATPAEVEDVVDKTDL